MLYWILANLFAWFTIRCHRQGATFLRKSYPFVCCALLQCAAQPVSNGDSNYRYQRAAVPIDEVDQLLMLEDDSLLEAIQAATFKYFWDFAHPISGMARERNTSGDLVTSGGSGFGIMAILVGMHRHFISREEGLNRLRQMVDFLQDADRFHGAWPHWLHGGTGKVIPFSAKDDGGDLVETSFLLQGLLTARSYFDADTEAEANIRQDINTLFEDVNWNWYRKQVQKQLFWHWSPNHGFDINLPIRGWNETMIAYILAISSPTHRVPANLYHEGWVSTNYVNNQTFYGYKLEVGRGTGGPLFFTHYSFLGFDPRNKRDAYANYYFQGANQTLINRAYCIENPKQFVGYGPDCWGLTASDDPDGYRAHAPNTNADNGTITPSASISSIVYTPEESLAAIRHLLQTYRTKVWGPMGFYDAFNPTRDWYADSYLAIDQGPIICMIENHRSGLLWELFMKNPEISGALDAIGFVSDSTTTLVASETIFDQIRIYPNPTDELLTIEIPKGAVGLKTAVMDLNGRHSSIQPESAHESIRQFSVQSLPPGGYFLRIDLNHTSVIKKFVKK